MQKLQCICGGVVFCLVSAVCTHGKVELSFASYSKSDEGMNLALSRNPLSITTTSLILINLALLINPLPKSTTTLIKG